MHMHRLILEQQAAADNLQKADIQLLCIVRSSLVQTSFPDLKDVNLGRSHGACGVSDATPWVCLSSRLCAFFAPDSKAASIHGQLTQSRANIGRV
eukprot:2243069-Amphidinium_carterae.1